MIATSNPRPSLADAAGPLLRDGEMRLFQELMYRKAGIRIADAKQNLVQGRLRKRLEVLGLPTFRAYHDHVTAVGHEDEFQRCLEALTTNETFFFRHKEHWDFLLDTVLPAWKRAAARGAEFRAWSAASSTGEEPYSLAIALAAALQGSGCSFRIEATDINTQVLARARSGIYGSYALQKITPACLARYFVAQPDGEHHRVCDAVRETVEFRSHNLMQPARGPAYDLVLLRNVLIYFDGESKSTVLANVGVRIVAGGHLILGGAETLSDRASEFTYVQPTIYRKR
jgi:chemotaxis protein methyltransferase CheR